MNRFVITCLCTSLLAGTAAAQTVPNSSTMFSRPDSNRVILRGVSSSAETSLPLSTPSMFSKSTPNMATEGKGDLANCNGCNQQWTDCVCPTGCGLTIFAEWMLLQPRGADAVFAARALNCFTPALDTDQIDFGAFDSFRVGFAKTVHNNCTEIGASFWMLEAQEEDSAARPIGEDVILPLLLHPSQLTCPGTTSTLARASAGIDFDRIAIDCKNYITWNCVQFDWLVGFGYGKLEQDLTAIYDENRVRVDSDLHGYGLRLGAGAAKTHRWISGYLHGDLTLLAANQSARFRSFDVFDGKEADVDQDLDRIVPILDLEVGAAFNVTCCMTIKVGYIYSIWWNVVTNQSFVEDVQHGDISGGSDDCLTFDGVFARVEFVF